MPHRFGVAAIWRSAGTGEARALTVPVVAAVAAIITLGTLYYHVHSVSFLQRTWSDRRSSHGRPRSSHTPMNGIRRGAPAPRGRRPATSAGHRASRSSRTCGTTTAHSVSHLPINATSALTTHPDFVKGDNETYPDEKDMMTGTTLEVVTALHVTPDVCFSGTSCEYHSERHAVRSRHRYGFAVSGSFSSEGQGTWRIVIIPRRSSTSTPFGGMTNTKS